MLEHGGRLRRAASATAFRSRTGWTCRPASIRAATRSRHSVRSLAASAEDDDGLEVAAARYYGSDELLAVAGSQAAIQALPALIAGDRVTVLAPTYAEHPHAWRGRPVRACAEDDIDAPSPIPTSSCS